MKTNASQRLEHNGKESLMVDGSRQFQVSKVTRIGLVVEVPQAGIVGAAVYGLAVDLGFVAGHAGGDFAAIDGNGLGDTVLSLCWTEKGR
jgi:hypothetical protein